MQSSEAVDGPLIQHDTRSICMQESYVVTAAPDLRFC